MKPNKSNKLVRKIEIDFEKFQHSYCRFITFIFIMSLLWGQMFRSASSGQDNRDGRSLNDIGKDYGRQVIVRQLNISVWSFISGTFAVKVSPLRTPNSRSLTTKK